MNKLILFVAAISFLCPIVQAQSTALTFDTGEFTVVKNTNNLTPLSGGSSADGNGFAVQVGYYSSATSGNNFLGTWTPITGINSLNTAFNVSTIGDKNDNGAGDGTFADTFVFDTTVASTVVTLPSSGQILAVRFYNATTVAAATHFAAASKDLWTWISPATPQSTVIMSLGESGLVWQGGFTAYTGNLLTAIPEPSTYAGLAGLAVLGFAALRRRRA